MGYWTLKAAESTHIGILMRFVQEQKPVQDGLLDLNKVEISGGKNGHTGSCRRATRPKIGSI